MTTSMPHHLVFQGTPTDLAAWLPEASANEVGTAWVLIGLQGRLDMAETMAEAGHGVETSDSAGLSALMCASSAGHLDLVRWLLDRGADPVRQYVEKSGETMGAVWLAIRDRHLDVLEVLLPHVPASTIDALRPSPLLLACQKNGPIFIRTLWKHGCTLDVRFDDGRSYPWDAVPRMAIELAAEQARRERQLLAEAHRQTFPAHDAEASPGPGMRPRL
jgi:hypothetical protein